MSSSKAYVFIICLMREDYIQFKSSSTKKIRETPQREKLNYKYRPLKSDGYV